MGGVIWCVMGMCWICGAFWVTNKNWSLRKNVIINILFLLISLAFVSLSKGQHEVVEIYICLFIFTVLGMLARMLCAPVLNLLRTLTCRLTKKQYVQKTYFEYVRTNKGMKNPVRLMVMLCTLGKLMMFTYLVMVCVKTM